MGWMLGAEEKGKMIEEEGQAPLFLFSMSEVVKTSNTNQMLGDVNNAVEQSSRET